MVDLCKTTNSYWTHTRTTATHCTISCETRSSWIEHQSPGLRGRFITFAVVWDVHLLSSQSACQPQCGNSRDAIILPQFIWCLINSNSTVLKRHFTQLTKTSHYTDITQVTLNSNIMKYNLMPPDVKKSWTAERTCTMWVMYWMVTIDIIW